MNKWKHIIHISDVFHNEALTFEQRRDRIVERIRRSEWFKEKDMFDVLPGLVDELGDSVDPDKFDLAWNAIYDEVDADRVWVDTQNLSKANHVPS